MTISIWTMAATYAVAIPPLEVEHDFFSYPDTGFDWTYPEPPRVFWGRDSDFQHADTDIRTRNAQTALTAIRDQWQQIDQLPTLIMARLESGEPQIEVKRALVGALCQIRPAECSTEQLTQIAAAMWKAAREDRELLLLVEDAFARWKLPIALDAWQNRVKPSDKVIDRRLLITAITGLGETQDVASLPDLIRLVSPDRGNDAVQLAAAKAIGLIATENMEPVAVTMTQQRQLHPQHDLLAAWILQKHTSPESRSILTELVQSQNPEAAKAAYRSLCNGHPEKAIELATNLLSHPDHDVRRSAAIILNSTQQPSDLQSIAKLLSDPNPGVRNDVRRLLLSSADNTKLRDVVLRLAAENLSSPDWQACEQAVLITTAMKDREQVPQLLTMLDHPRGEVNIAAAWGLKRMVDSQLHLEQMLAHANLWTDVFTGSKPMPINRERSLVDFERVAHLLESFGEQKFEPSIPLLRSYLVKSSELGYISRTAAIWSLGQLYEGNSQADLSSQLQSIIADKTGMNPELEIHRFAATLNLGFMQSVDAKPALIAQNEGKGSMIYSATTWTLMQIENAGQESKKE